MKKTRKYIKQARKLFPEEHDKEMLALIARCLERNNGKEPAKEELGF